MFKKNKVKASKFDPLQKAMRLKKAAEDIRKMRITITDNKN